MNTPRTALEECLRLAELATPGTIELWTSNSWRRLVALHSGGMVNGQFLTPCVDSDGHPNMECGQDYVNAHLAAAAINLLRTHGQALSEALGAEQVIQLLLTGGFIAPKKLKEARAIVSKLNAPTSAKEVEVEDE